MKGPMAGTLKPTLLSGDFCIRTKEKLSSYIGYSKGTGRDGADTTIVLRLDSRLHLAYAGHTLRVPPQ